MKQPIACAAAPIASRGVWRHWRPACRNAPEGDDCNATDIFTSTSTSTSAANRRGTRTCPRRPNAGPHDPSRVGCVADLEVGTFEAGRDREGSILDRVSEGDRLQKARVRRRQGRSAAYGSAAGPSAALLLRALRFGAESRSIRRRRAAGSPAEIKWSAENRSDHL